MSDVAMNREGDGEVEEEVASGTYKRGQHGGESRRERNRKRKARELEEDEAGDDEAMGAGDDDSSMALEDPRLRHRRELEEFVEKLKEMREIRSSLPKKSLEDRERRNVMTKDLANMETEFRQRQKDEVEAYLASLKGDAKREEREQQIAMKRHKKKVKVTRKRHTLALKR